MCSLNLRLRLTTAALVVIALLGFATPQHVQAVAYTWSGTGNWDNAGNWGGGPPAGGDTGAINSGTATANVVLAGGPDITVGGTGTLIHPIFAAATPIAGSITVQSGGTLDWTGVYNPSPFSSNDLTPIFFDGGSKMKRSSSDANFSVNAPLTFNAGTTTVTGVAGSVDWSPYSLTLTGTLSNVGAANLLVSPTSTSDRNALRINSSVANPYAGTAQVSGTGSVHGVLALQGTGALQNATGITIDPNGVLRLNTGTDLLGSITVPVVSGARVEWGGLTTYTGTAPVIDFQTGSTLGRGDSDVPSSMAETINIAGGQTATVTRVLGTVDWSQYALTLTGTLQGSGQLKVSPVLSNEMGAFRLMPSVANPFTGTVVVEGTAAVNGTLTLSGTGALKNILPGAITINPFGKIVFDNSIDALPSGYALSVNSGARIEWYNGSTYTSTAPTLNFNTGSTLGRNRGDVLNNSVSTENIAINGNVTATGILGTVTWEEYALKLTGALTGSGTLRIEPAATGSQLGALAINPTVANNSFSGTVQVAGNGVNTGTLGLEGTGALANVSTLTVENKGILRFAGATDPLPSGFTVNVQTGGRIEWLGTGTTYTVTPPTLLMQNGTFIGRSKNDEIATAKETISLAAGATVTADLAGTVLRQQYSTTLSGILIGNNTTTLHVKPSITASKLGVLQITSTAGNSSFAGTALVDGISNATPGVLLLNGVSPLGTGKVNIGGYGIVSVGTNGALNGVNSINVQNNGLLAFRTGGATLSNTTLTGNGVIRSERALAISEEQNGTYSLASLSLINTIVAPGNSAGTLTFNTTSLSLSSNSTLQIELGSLSDLIDVNGVLNLTAGPTLSLAGIAGLGTGAYVIATYDSLTGTFGSIVGPFDPTYVFGGIDYGTGLNSQITVFIAAVPEPSGLSLLGLGLCGIIVRSRRRGNALQSSAAKS